MKGLVLSIFPGLDLLGRAFEQMGFCVVRGPDLVWGGDIRTFHPPSERFDGIIGGPPCQDFVANLSSMCKSQGKKTLHGNLIPEFERVVCEAKPAWFIMENVRLAPIPEIEGYNVDSKLYNNRCTGAVQDRVRRISFGSKNGFHLLLDEVLFLNPKKKPTVLGADTGPRRRDGTRINYTLAEACELQGLPGNFFDNEYMPFRKDKARELVGNGVPLTMGRSIATAVQRAING